MTPYQPPVLPVPRDYVIASLIIGVLLVLAVGRMVQTSVDIEARNDPYRMHRDAK